MDYFPEHWALECRGGYRGAFRIFVNQPPKMVSRNGQVALFATAEEAKEQARQTLLRYLNPPIKAEKIEVPHGPLEDEYEDFLARRAQAEAEERARVFGEPGPSTYYPGHGRPAVVVETRHRRRA